MHKVPDRRAVVPDVTPDNAVSQPSSMAKAAPKGRFARIQDWVIRYGEQLLLLAVGIAVLKYLKKI